ncbi:MAG TPA: acyl carrier protein [Marmoricola sp.]|nr:acyl carrier protein [Marmoricola sp.]HNI70248.1 acyl carrier protein [Marmoricola sp.]HNJ79454.1 acyl carrier protein [Marmoricola sp.]HNN47912.1 acyl carrier protein [Marmoricola sp.]
MSARDELRTWVREHDRRPELPLDADTPLFVDRRLTSLDLPELILMLEEWAERTISVTEVAPESFATMAAIEKTFL